MKLQDAIEWIATNDEPLEININVIKDQISVVMLSDISGKDIDLLATKIYRLRKKWGYYD
jgi:hypothetical protein